MSSYVRDWLSYLRGLRLGQAASTTGWVLSFTIEDLAWVCRSLGRETGGSTGQATDAVVAAYIQFAYLHRNDVVTRKDGRKLDPPHTVADVALFYSSAVNPYWRNRGTEFVQAERNRHATMSPWVLQAEYPGLLEHVIGLLRGKLDVDLYRGLVEFAECDWGEGRHGPRDAQIGGNCFWYSGGSSMWRPGLLRVVGPAPRSKSKILVPLALQLAGGLAVAFGPELAAVAIALPFVPP
jgi:hypothetical protein